VNPAEVVERAAVAVREVKYRRQGVINGKRRDLPPTVADRRYAVAACSSLLRALSDYLREGGRISGGMLVQLANEVERRETPR
jgi:hypothetical protein